jgi:N-acetylneuraminic acid mutarotase
MKLMAPWIARWTFCLLLLAVVVLPQAQALDDFVSTGSMNDVRDSGYTSTLLPNGKVLVAGGRYYAGGYPNSLSSAELYDPATGLWTPTGSMNVARNDHTATLLPNGQVLVTGGTINNRSHLSSAELYDPATGSWSATGSMIDNRSNHTATQLPNGKVLVTGGYSYTGSANIYGSDSILSSAELYDPATGAWSIAGSMNYTRYGHTAILLATGKVLVIDDGGNPELYDPATGGWSPTGSMSDVGQYYTTTLLANGKVCPATIRKIISDN